MFYEIGLVLKPLEEGLCSAVDIDRRMMMKERNAASHLFT